MTGTRAATARRALLALAGLLALLPRGAEGRPVAEVARLVEAASQAMRQARETGDPTWYGHARAAVERGRAIDPDDFPALRAHAWVLLGLHEFAAARAAAEAALAREPGDWPSWANLTDALVELGEYDRAAGAADRLAALRPGVAAWTRVAGLQGLLGNRRPAIATLELAAAAAAAEPEALAWTLVHLGHEQRALGRHADAAGSYERALAAFPDFHLALVGLARARATQGRLGDAIDLADRAFERVPAPETAGLLGDLHDAAVDRAEAERHWDLVRVMERLAAAKGSSYGREVALFLADHDRDLPEALRIARADVAARPDVHGSDVLAWALHKNGRHAEAKRAATRALRLGTESAGFHYHAGMIARALHRPRAAARHLARALALDPGFDVRQAPVARAALNALDYTRLARATGTDTR